MDFGRGLKRSTSPRKGRCTIAGHPLLLSSLSGGALLAAPPPFDQGQTETCWAHSLAAGLWTSANAQRKTLPFVPSPLAIASLGYGLIRARAILTGELPLLTDDGAELQDGDDVIAQWGVAPLQAFVDGRNSDVPEGSPFPEPRPLEVELQGQHLVVGPYSIPVDSNADVRVAQCLDAGIVVWNGGLVGSATQNLQPGQIEQPTPESDSTAGGHARFIRGYRENASGQLEFLVRNSWGASWCGTGECWASTAWLLAQWDLWPLLILGGEMCANLTKLARLSAVWPSSQQCQRRCAAPLRLLLPR